MAAAGALRLIRENLPRLPADAVQRAAALIRENVSSDYLDPDFWRGIGMVLRYQLEANADLVKRRLTGGYELDAFGMDYELVEMLRPMMRFMFERYWRVEMTGLEHIPEFGRGLIVANHSGVLPWDGAMLACSLLLEGEPPRIVRGMGEYYLPTLPFFNIFMHRCGSVVGTPGNCARLLEQEEAIMVFPEGQRGFVKTFAHRYELQEFGLGFLRLALQTETPIVPVGIVGAEEQSPGLANLRRLGRLVGAPAFPVTLTFPWLGLAGFLPLPVKFRIHFGAPLRFEGDPDDEDAAIAPRVERVKQAIRELVAEARAQRRSWFA